MMQNSVWNCDVVSCLKQAMSEFGIVWHASNTQKVMEVWCSSLTFSALLVNSNACDTSSSLACVSCIAYSNINKVYSLDHNIVWHCWLNHWDYTGLFWNRARTMCHTFSLDSTILWASLQLALIACNFCKVCSSSCQKSPAKSHVAYKYSKTL